MNIKSANVGKIAPLNSYYLIMLQLRNALPLHFSHLFYFNSLYCIAHEISYFFFFLPFSRFSLLFWRRLLPTKWQDYMLLRFYHFDVRSAHLFYWK